MDLNTKITWPVIRSAFSKLVDAAAIGGCLLLYGLYLLLTGLFGLWLWSLIF